jgi:hypothetical protein
MAITQAELEQHNTAVNPFAPTVNKDLNAGTVEIESSRAIAEVRVALISAKNFPRDTQLAYSAIMQTCSRPDFAEAASYSYPRGRETVTGPSIRLAEELARSWGNLEFGIRELAQYDEETEVEAYCWDIQTNVRSKQTFRVKHERFTRSGTTKLVDPRDIYENNANLGARRLRQRILAIIPPDLVTAALLKCRETLVGGKTVPQDRLATMIKKFDAMGIKRKHIEARLMHKVESVNIEEYADICAIYKSIEDGMSNACDWFASIPKGTTVTEEAAKATEALSKPVTETKEEQPTDPTTELRASIDNTLGINFSGDIAAINDFVSSNCGASSTADATHDQLMLIQEALK